MLALVVDTINVNTKYEISGFSHFRRVTDDPPWPRPFLGCLSPDD